MTIIKTIKNNRLRLLTPLLLISYTMMSLPAGAVDKTLAPIEKSTVNETPPPWEVRPDAVGRSVDAASLEVAQGGHTSVENWYRNRKRTETSVNDEFTRLKTEAQSGKPEAQYKLALFYRRDDNPQADVKQSLDWQQKAAQAGYIEAQYGLGLLYANGQYVNQDPAQAKAWFQKAAAQGHEAARLALDSLPESAPATTAIAEVKQDNPTPATPMAVAPPSVSAVPAVSKPTAVAKADTKPKPAPAPIKETITTIELEEPANAQAELPPVNALPASLKTMEADTEMADTEMADAEPEKEPEQASPVSQDDASAIKQAAEDGDKKSQLMLGTMYEDGLGGMPVNLEQAANWYTQAAKQGYANAQYNLGLLYEDGRGIKQDFAQAVYWYEKASKAGFIEAKNNLGVLYVMGNGVKKDAKTAERLFREAAAAGNADAQRNLDMLKGKS